MSTALINTHEALAVAVVEAIHTGDVPTLQELLDSHSGLAAARLGNAEMTRTLLQVATDWPGHYPSGPAIVTALVAAGAGVDGRFTGPHTERRCAGRPVATTSPSWTPCSTWARTSKLTAR